MGSSSYARVQIFAMLFVGAVVFVSAADAARAGASIITEATSSNVDIPWEAELATLASEQFNTLYHGYDTLNTTNIHNSVRLLMSGLGLHISNSAPQSSAANTAACQVGCQVGIGSCKAACSFCFGCCSSACDLGLQPCLNSCGNSLCKTSDPLRAA